MGQVRDSFLGHTYMGERKHRPLTRKVLEEKMERRERVQAIQRGEGRKHLRTLLDQGAMELLLDERGKDYWEKRTNS